MPIPKAKEIKLSETEKEILEKHVRRKSSSQSEVLRATIILEASSNKSSKIISDKLGITRVTVRLWRNKWFENKGRLELLRNDRKKLEKLILTEILVDEQRPGSPSEFSIEEITKIIALACEKPENSGYPISHWTIRELRDEILKRGIVKEISWSSVRRFLKSGGVKTS